IRRALVTAARPERGSHRGRASGSREAILPRAHRAGVLGRASSGASVRSPEAMSMTQTTTNRLAGETSPYLLQHAHNPVDWYPWGAEAFERARREDKPIFLSIGYAACHWCHVMERESFENPEIARYLNEHFV